MTQYCSICGKEIRPEKEAFYVSNNVYTHINCINNINYMFNEKLYNETVWNGSSASTQSCKNCWKSQLCQKDSETTCCSAWSPVSIDDLPKTKPIEIQTSCDDTIPNRPYPNIFELEDRIKVLEEKIRILERKL